MIKIDTVFTIPGKTFETKTDFKNYVVDRYAPEIDPLRKYNHQQMAKYGDGFFYLQFIPPNKGKLNHIYQNEGLYWKSKYLRDEQQRLFEEEGLFYDVGEPYTFNKRALTKERYYKLHTKPLVPTDIKIDPELFKLEIGQFDQWKFWGDLYQQYPRMAIPLVNMNGSLNNDPDPACYPLDRWNFLQSGEKDFNEYLFGVSQFEMGPLFEISFTQHTPVLDLKSLRPLDPLKKYMTRSCILKWDAMGHFNPHFDTWHPTRWLRLWGTTDPDKMKLRYKVDGEPKNTINKVKDKWERYEPVENIEAGRLYLHDSIQWHDAFAFEDDVYQFFISLNLDAYGTIEARIQ